MEYMSISPTSQREISRHNPLDHDPGPPCITRLSKLPAPRRYNVERKLGVPGKANPPRT